MSAIGLLPRGTFAIGAAGPAVRSRAPDVADVLDVVALEIAERTRIPTAARMSGSTARSRSPECQPRRRWRLATSRTATVTMSRTLTTSNRAHRIVYALAPTIHRDTFDPSRATERQVEESPMELRIEERVGAAARNDAPAAERLFATLYDELRRLAERQLRRGGPQLTLSATTLLHEAYLALRRSDAEFPDRARFMGYVARAMRGLIIDYARRSRAKKRGGGAFEITLTPELAADRAVVDAHELERLCDALEELGGVQPALAELVDLHFFGGLSFVEIAELRGVSERTVQRDWRKARLFLYQTLGDEPAA
jgi:RNA polymerase sigma factor (TIGR02999 family)